MNSDRTTKVIFFKIIFRLWVTGEMPRKIDNKILKLGFSLPKPSIPEIVTTLAYHTIYFQDGKIHQKILVPEREENSFLQDFPLLLGP